MAGKTNKVPPRGKWPEFHTLAIGKYFSASLEHHTALRTKATRVAKKLKREFSVRKESLPGGEVIRVYRTK